jgi:hypothetical protein
MLLMLATSLPNTLITMGVFAPTGFEEMRGGVNNMKLIYVGGLEQDGASFG